MANGRGTVKAAALLLPASPRSLRRRNRTRVNVGLGYRVLIGFAFVAVPTVLTFALYPANWVLAIGVVLLLVFGLT